MTNAAAATAIILAAGEGTRMRSDRPKVVHEVAGRSMINHVVGACREAGFDTIVVVVGAQSDAVEAEVRAFDRDVKIRTQEQRLGTAHAVLAARDTIESSGGAVVVLNADGPLITSKTLSSIADKDADLVVLGFDADEPFGYGRMVTDGDRLLRIVEEKDADPDERKVRFCNSGIMSFDAQKGLRWLDAIENDNAKGEFYLTDIVSIANRNEANVIAGKVSADETLGVNDRVQLAEIEVLWQVRRRREMMSAGVQMQAPATVWLSADTRIGTNTVLEPNIWFGPGCEVGDRVRIRANTYMEGAKIEDGAEVGPFARLRPGTRLGPKTKVGNFVETKNVDVAEGSKINHLSYIGDTTIGMRSNVGAGTITCNYDGYLKHRTTIGDQVFVGSNTSLVAPVSIGAGANIAAGSVIVDDVEEDALAFGRSRQTTKRGRARELRAALEQAKRARSN